MNLKLVKKNKHIIEFFDQLPFNKLIGISLISVGDSRAEMSVAYNGRLIGDSVSRVIHGGVITTLIDAACGAAVMSAGMSKFPTATIDLRIDYLRPANPGETIIANAHCYKMTSSVAFVRAEAIDDNERDPVALASGAFTSPS